MRSGAVAERIATVASLLDVRVQVTEAREWEVRDGTVVAGIAWYATDGFDDETLTAQVLLDLWAGVVLDRQSPARATRRRALARTRPELEPLLQTIDRIQAGGELITSFPSFRRGVERSVASRFGADLRAAPPEAQFLAQTLITALAPGASCIVLPHVENARVSELELRVALTPVQPRDPHRTFLRLLACLIDAYERLRTHDNRGLTDAGESDAPRAGESPFGDDGAGSPEAGAHRADELDADSSESEASSESPSSEPTRPGSSRENAEGADLFEAKQAAEIIAMLETPLASSQDITGPVDVGDAQTTSVSAQTQNRSQQIVRARTEQRIRLTKYIERVHAHEREIEALRVAWGALVTDRITWSHRLGTTAEREGDMLLREAIPGAIAEARAGVARPRVYSRLEHLRREREEFGNLDVVILIDRSGSMRGAAPVAADASLVVTEALAAVGRDLRDEERRLGVELGAELRTALMVFDTEPVIVKPLSAMVDDASRARLFAEALVSGGSTNDGAALDVAAHLLGLDGARPVPSRSIHRRRLVVVISDGGSAEPQHAAVALSSLRSHGVTVFGIGVRSDALTDRYAPDARRVDDPRDIARVLGELITRAVTPGRRGRDATI